MMIEALFGSERMSPATWAQLSSLLTVAIYFKFSRLWSFRNLDLILLISLAPALLLVSYGLEHPDQADAGLVEHVGYIWLFAASGLLLLRLLVDVSLVRRPLLEPNLSVGGMTFLAVALCAFLIANVITGPPNEIDLTGSHRAAQLSAGEAASAEQSTLRTHGPGFTLLYLLPHISTQRLLGDGTDVDAPLGSSQTGQILLVHSVTARVMAILSQLLIVIGLVVIGLRHLDNIKTGIAVATLYLLMPYTSLWAGNVTHALPGALLVWAVALYRWPLISGSLLGLAFGTIYYPLFLFPLWISFYWRRGRWRFLIGAGAMLLALILVLFITSDSFTMFAARVQQMFGLRLPIGENLSGAWSHWNGVYRYPILAAYIGLSLSFAIWPPQKDLAVLMSCSAALLLGTQFWHAHSGGLALAWYLPLMLMTFFRPNLEDRVALAVVRRGRMRAKAA